MRTAAALLVLIASIATGACDPCSGLSICNEPPAASAWGMMVDDEGNGVPDVRLAFTRTGGVPLARDSFTEVTDTAGRFELTVRADSLGVSIVDVAVAPPGRAAFRIRDVALPISGRADQQFLARWTVAPFLAYLVALRLRGNGQPISNAPVTNRRVGGVTVAPEARSLTTNPDGYFWIDPMVTGVGDSVVEAIDVTVPGQNVTLARTGLTLPVLHSYRQEVFMPIAVGPNMHYVGRVLYPDDTVAEGITVGMKRIGGIPLVEDSFTFVTNGDGYFAVQPVLADPYREGDLAIRLHINAPAPYRSITVDSLLFSTFDSDVPRSAGLWKLQQ